MSRAMVSVMRKLTVEAISSWSRDESLLTRYRDYQDETAFTTLVKRYSPMVQQVCHRTLTNQSDAEDACQTTFLILARQPGQVKKASSVKSWLYGVALRVSYQIRRKTVRQAAQRAKLRLPEDQPSALEHLSASELHQLLKAELVRLPDKYRRVLELSYWEGRSRDEIAVSLGWTPGTVKGQLERAKRKLKDQLVQQGVELSLPLGMGLFITAAYATLPSSIHAAISSPKASFTWSQLLSHHKIYQSAKAMGTIKSIASLLMVMGTLQLNQSSLSERLIHTLMQDSAIEVEVTWESPMCGENEE